jgi:hypothetical protein
MFFSSFRCPMFISFILLLLLPFVLLSLLLSSVRVSFPFSLLSWSGLTRSPSCVSCVSPYQLLNAWINAMNQMDQSMTKLPTYIKPPEPISTAYFINSSLLSECLYAYPCIFARQRIGKKLPWHRAHKKQQDCWTRLLYAVRAVSKESRQLVLSRTSSLFIFVSFSFVMLVLIFSSVLNFLLSSRLYFLFLFCLLFTSLISHSALRVYVTFLTASAWFCNISLHLVSAHSTFPTVCCDWSQLRCIENPLRHGADGER